MRTGKRHDDESGFLMVALLVGMAVAAVYMSAALPARIHCRAVTPRHLHRAPLSTPSRSGCPARRKERAKAEQLARAHELLAKMASSQCASG